MTKQTRMPQAFVAIGVESRALYFNGTLIWSGVAEALDRDPLECLCKAAGIGFDSDIVDPEWEEADQPFPTELAKLKLGPST